MSFRNLLGLSLEYRIGGVDFGVVVVILEAVIYRFFCFLRGRVSAFVENEGRFLFREYYR